MRKFIFIVFLFVILGFLGILIFKNKVSRDLAQPVFSPTSFPTPTDIAVNKQGKTSLSLFVPYWTIADENIDSQGFDKLIYFGIKPDKTGVGEGEIKQLEKFNSLRSQDAQALAAVVMTDSQENLQILNNENLQEKIIDQSIEAVKNNNMGGVVLDLEISAIPFDSLTKQISDFTAKFYKKCKENGLVFGLALYGDTLYRPRPYEVKTLGKNADKIMIMAYDFHKANGNPGPNFPLAGGEKYGYDMKEMVQDFLQQVPPDKITVIFGLFGYDWTVTDKGSAAGQGEAMSLSKIKSEFGNYQQKRDKTSGETQILYTDSERKKHVVWFEDMESVKRKEDFLRGKGINAFSYWAYSYY